MNARVTASSQSHRLRERLEGAEVKHGATVRADIPRVRVAVGAAIGAPVGTAEEGEIYFCNVEPIKVRRRIMAGDDETMPETVQLDGLEFPGAGEYDVIDALVATNGDIRIIADDATQIRARRPSLMSFIG